MRSTTKKARSNSTQVRTGDMLRFKFSLKSIFAGAENIGSRREAVRYQNGPLASHFMCDIALRHVM